MSNKKEVILKINLTVMSNKNEEIKEQSIKIDYDNRYQLIADAAIRIQKR